MNVLLVDNDTNFRRSLAIGLEVMGYTTFEAKSGVEALGFLQTNQKSHNKVESVVADARIPGLDGFWLTDQISVLYPSVKVVILSSHSYVDKLDKYTVMTKPIRIPKLVQVLQNKDNPVSSE